MWKAHPDVIHTRAPRGGVLLDVRRKVYFSLNETGATLWKVLERGASEAELVSALLDAYDTEELVARRDVESLLGELEQAHLVERRGAG